MVVKIPVLENPEVDVRHTVVETSDYKINEMLGRMVIVTNYQSKL